MDIAKVSVFNYWGGVRNSSFQQSRINFSGSYSDRDIEKLIANGTFRKVGAGQENEVFTNDSVDFVIKRSLSTNPQTISRMRKNLHRESNLVQDANSLLANTNTRIA